jgi:hypothetical protein
MCLLTKQKMNNEEESYCHPVGDPQNAGAEGHAALA